MAELKYNKYIVSELKPPATEAPWNPPPSAAGKGTGGRVLYLDSEQVPGAYYMECSWVMPRPAMTEEEVEAAKERGPKAHTHDYDEIFGFIGTNHDDPYDLGAEVELWLGDERHIITKTSLVFVPAGLKHSPLVFRRVDRPVFNYTTGPGKMYY